MKVVNFGNYIKIEDESFFDIFQTFDCGQTFRFEKIGEDVVEGVAHGKLLRMKQTKDGCVEINCTSDEFERVWKHYLALDRDYSEINAYFSLGNDEVLKKAKEEDAICICGAPIPKEAEDELIRLFAKKFLEHSRAMLDAERKPG